MTKNRRSGTNNLCVGAVGPIVPSPSLIEGVPVQMSEAVVFVQMIHTSLHYLCNHLTKDLLPCELRVSTILPSREHSPPLTRGVSAQLKVDRSHGFCGARSPHIVEVEAVWQG